MGIFEKYKQAKAGKQLKNAIDVTTHGRVLSSRFFKRYFVQTTAIVAVILVYISCRYDSVTAMETITSLNSELEICKTELQNQRSHYMSSTRESAMQQLVDTLGLGLGIQDRPPFKLSYEDHADKK